MPVPSPRAGVLALAVLVAAPSAARGEKIVARRPRSDLMAAGYLGFTAAGALFGWAVRSDQRGGELAASIRRDGDGTTSPAALTLAGAGLSALAVSAMIGAAVIGEPADRPVPLTARWAPWAAVAVVAGGVGLYYRARYHTTRRELASVLSGSDVTLGQVRELEDRFHRQARGASLAIGAAVGAIGASASAYFLGRSTAPGVATVQATYLGRDVGLAVGGRF